MGSYAQVAGRVGRGVAFLPAGLLSNGEYVSILTAAGTGGSFWRDDALTRWRPDRTADTDGVLFWLRDRDLGVLRSLTRHPAGGEAEREQTRWRPGVFELERVVDDLETRIEACVACDRPLELRRVRVRNLAEQPRALELSATLEVVLQRAEADASHPAFSKLFVETAFDASHQALVAGRRPRDRGARHPWLAATLGGPGALEFETDRARLWGRGRFSPAPELLVRGASLPHTTGNVLDPVFCLRRHFDLEPGASESFTLALAAGESWKEATETLATARSAAALETFFAAAEAHELGWLDRLGLDEEQAREAQALWVALRYGWSGAPRGAGRGDPGALARYGVRPAETYVFFLARGPESSRCAHDLLRRHAYWRAKGIAAKLILVHESGDRSAWIDEARATEDCWAGTAPAEDIAALESFATIVATEEAAEPFVRRESGVEWEEPRAVKRPAAPEPAVPPAEALREFNGFGGFSADGAEYVVRFERTSDGSLRLPPQPWINVVAQEGFGFLASETGSLHTWSRNSREHRLTPWSNDPVLDPHGEAFYVRDEESGAFWSATPGPAPGPGRYETRHGIGYSRYAYAAREVEHELRVFLDAAGPAQVALLSLVNRGGAERTLTVFAYRRLVLGTLPELSSASILTERDAETGALFATNPRAGQFARGVVFASLRAAGDARAVSESYTCDREEFLGESGSMASPAALGRPRPLSASYGGGMDPCFAELVSIRLRPGEKASVVALFGEAVGPAEARRALAGLRTREQVEASWENALEAWRAAVDAIRVRTPSPALDHALNGWLAYQALSCRLLGRTAFYQSGGAFGFRDQLQDGAGLAAWDPELLRDQIVLHAGHQFVEGDVLHWWHPPDDRGLRTRFADDLVWLPWAVAHYLDVTGDETVLAERAGYLTAPLLAPGEDEAFLRPRAAGKEGDVYDHCVRALDHAMTTGAHGLPLFGSGDWNDGMNRVGREGKGESVWMGFFLYAVLGDFLPVCERRGDRERVGRYRAYRESVRAAIEFHGWDGAWYRRAFYDDGTPMGSIQSDECQIDALVQAWAVLSGAAAPDRAARAMDAVEERLISDKDGIIRLLTPPFRHSSHDPGYIQGYAAGVRENGGQYTHAALWVVRAMAELRRRDRAAPLLEMLTPLSHALLPQDVERYRVEPYVIAADVYGEPPHVGRGGWTWYTGSAGWMLRVGLESILGFRVRQGRAIEIRPCIPPGWPEYRISYRPKGRATVFEIHLTNPEGKTGLVRTARLDGEPWPTVDGAVVVPVDDDSLDHQLEIVLE
jgi:cyclic beta-1,2-glucan synthetase